MHATGLKTLVVNVKGKPLYKSSPSAELMATSSSHACSLLKQVYNILYSFMAMSWVMPVTNFPNRIYTGLNPVYGNKNITAYECPNFQITPMGGVTHRLIRCF